MGTQSAPTPLSAVPTRGELLAGGALVAAAIAGLFSAIGGIAVLLVVMLLVSLAWWATGRWRMDSSRVFPRAAAAVVVLVAHVAEEAFTGLPRELPRLFGYRPWSDATFLAINGTALVVFFAATLAVRRGVRLAYLPVIFLAVGAGIANGVAHTAAALYTGGYFPGLATAPLVLIAGVALVAALRPGPRRGHAPAPAAP